MGISDFLATAASNFRSHYIELAARNKSDIKSHSRLVDPVSTQDARTRQVDRFVPSGIRRNDDAESSGRSDHGKRARHVQDTERAGHDRFDSSSKVGSKAINRQGKNLSRGEHDDDSEGREHSQLEKAPDGTYSYRRTSSLKIKLDLRFELGAITRIAQRLENGEVTKIDSFAAAGFGLQAVMQAEGRQVVETSFRGESGSDESDSSNSEFRLKERSSASARLARQFAYQDDNFAMKAFSEESANIRRTLDVRVRENQRRAVNSISMRFRLDSSFSFAQATRFNVQTNRVAEQAPEAVGQYLDTAGKVASSNASSDLLTGFFDAVDSYLDDSEKALLDKVTAFFDTAAEELGFSSGIVDIAREKLTQSISGFFDRVETALDSVASRFTSATTVSNVQPPAELPTPQANIPAPADFASPEIDKDRALLAVA